MYMVWYLYFQNDAQRWPDQKPHDHVKGNVTWRFKYNTGENQVQTLTKENCWSCWGCNQIMIQDFTVKMQASELAQGVKVSVDLPIRVRKVIVVKFGGDILCYAIDSGKKVYPGCNLPVQSTNPFCDKIPKSDKYRNGHGCITDEMIRKSLFRDK